MIDQKVIADWIYWGFLVAIIIWILYGGYKAMCNLKQKAKNGE